MKRPNPIQWLGYAVGRTLPPSCQEWVRHDLTGRYAVPRHVLRSLVPFVPIFIAFVVLLPGPIWLRVSTVLLGVFLAVFYSVAYMNQNRAKRLAQHGLPSDLVSPEVRARREADREAYRAIHERPQES
ncbi:MAG TPA: DUF5313 family protein [Aldersonia sp.]